MEVTPKARIVEIATYELSVWKPGHERFYWDAVGDPRSLVPAQDGRSGKKQWAWCAAFVSWVYAAAGYPLLLRGDIGGMAYVPYLWKWGNANGFARPAEYEPDPGDVVIYGSRAEGGLHPCHTGIVVAEGESIEGNYSNRLASVPYRKQKNEVLGFLAILPHEPEMAIESE